MSNKTKFKENLKNSSLIWYVLIIIAVLVAFIVIKLSYSNPYALPDFALKKEIVREGYEYALLNPGNLEGLPCNCGCMDPEGVKAHGGRLHSRGLLDCFMEGDIKNGGKWDPHASDCGMCIEDAVFVKQEYEEGHSKEEIKQMLEDKYSSQTFSNNTVYGGHND